MPTRVVIGGVPEIPGESMSEKRTWAIEHLDGLRGFLMHEPHGHVAMSGAILQQPTTPEADWGVLYIESTGFLPMCGHGTIGVATVLIETGLVEVTEPETRISLDTPAGVVEVVVEVSAGRALSVTIQNVPTFVLASGQSVKVSGFEDVSYEMVYGGNFYPIIEASELGLTLDLSHKEELISAGLKIISAVNDQNPPVHPGDSRISGIHHVQFVAPGHDGADSRNAVLNVPGYFDRSPCGTGTSAQMALRFARGQLKLNEPFINESMLGTRFTGRLIGTTVVAGIPAVIPTIQGRAWITGFSQHLLHPSDPFPSGFVV